MANIRSFSAKTPEGQDLVAQIEDLGRAYRSIGRKIDSVLKSVEVRSLAEREVQNNFLPVEPLPPIVESQKVSIGWESLELTMQKIAQFPNLQQLCLSHMNDERVREFAQNFRMVESLVTLDFSVGNQIGDEGAKVLIDLFRAYPNLRVLNLNRNQIGDEGAQAFAELLGTNRSMAMLCLDRNQIRDEGAKALAGALEMNRGLIIVDLSNNQMTATGAQAIMDALKINRTLKEIYFYYDPPAPFTISRV